MNEINTAIRELDRAFRQLLGPPSGRPLKYLKWWGTPFFEVAFEPRGRTHINVWLEARFVHTLTHRALKCVEYDAKKSRNANLAQTRRLSEGHPVLRVPCRPTDVAEVVELVRECAVAAGVVDGPPASDAAG